MNNRKQRPAEKLSSWAFYGLTVLTAAVFALYWLVGYNRPFADNPNFNAPLFTDAVIVLGYLLTALATGTALWTVFHTLHGHDKGDGRDNNIPTGKISYGVAAGIVLILAITFATGSSSEMVINGTKYTDRFWLKTSDMFICTCAVLLAVAVGSAVYGSTKSLRRK